MSNVISSELHTSSPYRTVKQFIEENPAFSEGGVRWQVFNEDANGLKASGAILRNGRKVLIHVPRYYKWLDWKNGIDSEAVDSTSEAA